MKISRSIDQVARRAPPETFTGGVWLQGVAVGETSEPLHVARVTFEPGARTFWHHHPRGQILIATAGVGRFQLKGGPTWTLRPGDSVSIAPGEVHWHGAAPDQLFVHTSIQAADARGEQATWLDPVSDEEYDRATD